MNVRPVRKTFLILGAIALALFVVGASTADAQQVPPSGGSLTIGAAEVPAAGTVPVSGAGCAPRAGVTLSVAGQPAGALIADAHGAFARTVVIPSGALGPVTVVATCTGPRNETRILTGPVVATDNLAGSQPLPPAHPSSSGIPTSAVLAFFVLCGVALLVFAAVRIGRRVRPRRAPVPRAPVLAPELARVPAVPVVRPAEPAPNRNAELLELAAGVASALERVTSVSERVIAHVEFSRAQLQTTLAAERADRRATLDALHELVRTIDAQAPQH
jgi:hypothetical protein